MDIPKVLQIESTARCNAKCSFCPVGVGLKRDVGEMSDTLFDKILVEANDLGIKTILIFLNGEPFIFSRFFDWLEKLRSYNMVTHVFTNASLMTKEKTDKLISYSDVVDRICFSVSGKDVESQRQTMDLPMDRVVENIRYFVSANAGLIKYWVAMPGLFDRAYRNSWVAFWNSIAGAEKAQVNPVLNWGGNIESTTKTNQFKYCSRLYHMTVLWDGRVNLCCMDGHGEVILGDLNTQTILEVYNGDLARHYRMKHKFKQQSDLKLCNACNMR